MSAPTQADLEAVAAFCKKHGIRRIRAGEIEMEFEPPSAPAAIDRIAEMQKALLEGQPSDEEMLFWSSFQAAVAVAAQGEAADGA